MICFGARAKVVIEFKKDIDLSSLLSTFFRISTAEYHRPKSADCAGFHRKFPEGMEKFNVGLFFSDSLAFLFIAKKKYKFIFMAYNFSTRAIKFSE